MIDVIIPFMNRPEYTKVLIDGLYSVDHGTQIAPILIDNFSRKRSKELIMEWKAAYTDLPEDRKQQVAEPRLIEFEVNKGFAGAVNAALSSYTPTEYVIIMHNDCVVFPGWAGEMLDCFKTVDDDIGVVIPRTSYANEQGPCIPDLRKKFEAIKPSNKLRLGVDDVLKVIDELYPDKAAFMASLKENPLKATYCAEIASFCMMTKSELFDKYGKFNEEFWPRSWEDKFWFRPMERDGYVCMVANHAFVHHFGNITSDGPGFCFPEDFAKNEKLYRTKCAEADAKASIAAPAVKAAV